MLMCFEVTVGNFVLPANILPFTIEMSRSSVDIILYMLNDTFFIELPCMENSVKCDQLRIPLTYRFIYIILYFRFCARGGKIKVKPVTLQ